MIRAWRITKSKYADNAFDGEGARINGGRWTSPGTRVVYTSQSLSLATLEVLVHIRQPVILSSYVVRWIEFPGECIESIRMDRLPAAWRAFPSPRENQAAGDAWVRSAKSPVLKVPSAVIPQEFNYVINPVHEEFRRCRIGPLAPLDVDERVFQFP